MSEENVIVQEMSEVQQLAASYGWKADGKKSADDYIKFALEKLPERGEALTAQNKTIEAKDSEIGKMKSMLDELTVHMKKQKDSAYEQAMNDFKAQKRQAIIEGNVELVEELEAKQLSTPQENVVDPSIVDFEARNDKWLSGDSFEELEMQDWVQRHGQLLGKKKLPTHEHMARLEQDLHKKYPSYFEADESKSFSPVEGAGNSGVAGKSSANKIFTYKNLSDTQKQMAKYLNDSGHMKIEDYIKELVSFGDLK